MKDLLTEKQLKSFLDKISFGGDNECWNWIGCSGRGGYGRFSINKKGKIKSYLSHRLMFILKNKAFSLLKNKKQLVCHNCDNRICVNPNHLFIGSHKDNKIDSYNKNRHANGETNGRAKITEKDCLKMLYYRKIKEWTLPRIAKKMKCSLFIVENFFSKKSWNNTDIGRCRDYFYKTTKTSTKDKYNVSN